MTTQTDIMTAELADKRARLIARRVQGGANAEQSAELLAQLEAENPRTGMLAPMLAMHGFATDRGAEVAAHALIMYRSAVELGDLGVRF